MNEYRQSNHLFDVNKEFFLINSENLDQIETRMYGYSIQETGIYENNNLTADAIEHLDGCGCYVFIQADQHTIRIKQDYNGCWGIYLFEKDGYFALSSSFNLLLEHVKDRAALSLNRDYCNHILSDTLASLAYDDTPVNEIRLVDKNAVLLIDKKTRKLSMQYIDYKDNAVEIDSQEGINRLDRWYTRWTTLFRNLNKHTNRINADLSGGFDSRMTFMLMLTSGLNLNSVRIHSLNDTLHTHAEDYAIATEFAQKYQFELNRPQGQNRCQNYSLQDIVQLAYYTKMGFHKEMHFHTHKNEETTFCVTGAGGESVRAHWDATASGFIKMNQNYAHQYARHLWPEIKQSIEKIFLKNYSVIRQKYNITDEETPFHTIAAHREIRCRSHFGKGALERYFANDIEIAPLIDPLLRSVKLSSDLCPDDNLLFSVIYARYCPDMFTFRYEGGRSIDPATIATAQQINAKYAPYQPVSKSDDVFNVIVKNDLPAIGVNPPCEQQTIIQFFKTVFDSSRMKALFCTCFDENFYQVADTYFKTKPYHPLRHCYAVIALGDAADAVWHSQYQANDRITDRFEKMLTNPAYLQPVPDLLPESFRNAVSSRVDIIFVSEDENARIEIAALDSNAQVTQPPYLQKAGIGYSIHSTKGNNKLTIRTSGTGTLRCALRSKYVQGTDGKQVPHWVQYLSAELNGKQLCPAPRNVCHDKPISFSTPVSGDNTQTDVQYSWIPLTTVDPEESSRLQQEIVALKQQLADKA